MDSTKIKKIVSFIVSTFTIYYLLQSLIGQRLLNWYAKYEIYSKIESNDPDFVKLEVAYNLSDVGYILNRDGKHEGALELYEVSLAILRKLYDDDANKDITETLKSLASICSELERFEDAINYLKQLLEAFRKIYETDEQQNVFETLQSLGINYFRDGKHQEAVQYLKEAKSLFFEIYTEDDPNFQNSLIYLEQYIIIADIFLKKKMDQNPEPTEL